jgi:hypothetical protein
MSPPLLRYPLDITGVNPDNFVSAEPHTLQPVLFKALATTYGAFYTDSVIVTDTLNNRVLAKDVHFVCTELLDAVSELYGKEVCYLILITDPTVSTQVSVSYQALGGPYTRSADAIVNIYNLITNDTRPAEWPNIIGKPDRFVPGPHLHDIGDVYGFEYLVNSMERIRRAIQLSDSPVFEQVLDYIDRELEQVKQTVKARIDQISENFNLLGAGGIATNTQNGLMSAIDHVRLGYSLMGRTDRIKQYIASPAGSQVYNNTLSFTPGCAGRLVVISSLQRVTNTPGDINHQISVNGVLVDGDQTSLPSVGLTTTQISRNVICTISQNVSPTAPGTGTSISFGFVYIFIPAE